MHLQKRVLKLDIVEIHPESLSPIQQKPYKYVEIGLVYYTNFIKLIKEYNCY